MHVQGAESRNMDRPAKSRKVARTFAYICRQSCTHTSMNAHKQTKVKCIVFLAYSDTRPFAGSFEALGGFRLQAWTPGYIRA